MTVERDDLQSAGLEQGHIIDIGQVVRIDKNLEHRHKIIAVLIQETGIDGVVASGTGDGVRTCSERNSQLLCNPFVSQRLTRVLKLPKRALPTSFLLQKAYF